MKPAERSYHIKDIYIQEWNFINKRAILYIHGFPGCSDQAKLLTSTPHLKDFRLIAVDRPGYGLSKYQPQLTPMKFAYQLLEILDQLQIHEVSLLSVSGGAPYALALATLLEKRVLKVSSIGGIAPLTKHNRKYMNVKQKKAWWINRVVPRKLTHFVLNRYWQKGLEKIDQFMFTNLKDFSEPDQIVFSHPEISPALAETLKSALHKGPHGILHDMKVYSKHWGFSLDDVQCPVTLWHGELDDVVHSAYATEMKTRLPKGNLKIIPGEGHYSIAMNYRDQIIQDLMVQ